MAGFFSPQTLEQIRAASDVVEVIGSYLPLKRAGANFVALCPFHKEKTPSFHVNPHRQIFHCFGCHKGGDVFTFVKEYENIPFPDAVRRLAERAHIVIEFEQNPAHQETRQIKDRLLQIHEQIAQRWQNALANEAAGQAARDYLARRGVSEEAVKLFRLGAAPEAWDDTVNWARSKGFDLALVEQAGLILRKEGTDRYYDRFRGRLMFPICDEQGRVIAFSGRVLNPEQKGGKYVNSPETPIFTKSKVFYGLDKSKRAVLDAGFAVICEGQLDLIACYMAGVRNIVAPQGTAFTAEHARLLKRYVDEVVLCFDSDDAGQNAAVHALDHLLASGLAVRVAVVPAPHDPDSFIKAAGGEAFSQLITDAEDFFDYYLKRLCRLNDVTSDKGRLVVLREMAEAIHKTGNAVLVDNYAQKTALRLAVNPDAVRAEFRKLAKARPATPESPDEEQPPQSAESVPPPSPLERSLLILLLRHDESVPWLLEHFDPEWMHHETIRRIVVARLEAHRAGNWLGLPALLASFDDSAAKTLISEAALDDCGAAHPAQLQPKNGTTQRMIPIRGRGRPPSPAQQLLDVVTRLRNQHLDEAAMAYANRAALPETSASERSELLRKQVALREQKRTSLPLPTGFPY
ncbi:MAG TPA: DNA primase [Verrucomicrobiae bacterium]